MPRLRRTGNTVKLTVKLPGIGALSRSIVDAENERLRHSVIPIIGADARRRPYLIASAVVLVYRGRKVLVTAEHVLSDNEKVPLAFFGADGYSRPFSRDFVIPMEHDLAVKLLRPDEIDALSHVPFIAEADLGRATEVGERFYASVAGYPSTAAKQKDKVTLDTPMEVYSHLATELPDGSISVYFDKTRGGLDETGRQSVPSDPFGKSGARSLAYPLTAGTSGRGRRRGSSGFRPVGNEPRSALKAQASPC
jgi:hypothetical protein